MSKSLLQDIGIYNSAMNLNLYFQVGTAASNTKVFV
jgi:hypothetical protein